MRRYDVGIRIGRMEFGVIVDSEVSAVLTAYRVLKDGLAQDEKIIIKPSPEVSP